MTFKRDLFERVGWTALQAGLALVTVEALEVPTAWAVPVATVLAIVKGFVARKVGDPDSASTLSESEPAVEPDRPAPAVFE